MKAFGKYFRKPGVLDSKQLECEKAFLMCRPQDGWTGIPPAGLRRLHELMIDEEMKQILENDYNFGIRDYYKLLENHLYDDSILQMKKRQLQDEIKLLEFEKENLRNEIQMYAGSTSWKITKPLRALGNIRKRS